MDTITFKDYYNNTVQLSFTDHPFSLTPMHVWCICKFKDQWLLTEHPRRGIEFPGGKVEPGETADEAAVREVFEETGGSVSKLTYMGQYYVEGKGGKIIKNIYVAVVEKILLKHRYFETNGPVLLSELPNDIKTNKAYSFMMKDQVLSKSMEYARNQNLV